VSLFIRELAVIGSDVDNFYCPHCNCHDRERHLFMYFDKLQIWNIIQKSRLLHFAPEIQLMRTIQKLDLVEYVLADIKPTLPEIQKIDVTAIAFSDEYFDFLICNHVLEHVTNDFQALRELFRVLKQRGKAILQTPYSPLISKSFYDSKINTNDLRRRFYGQEDHVRLYGEDLFLKMEEIGFIVLRYVHVETLLGLDSTKYGVNPREDLILVIKP